MNVFSNLKSYAGKWQIKSSRKFNETELSLIKYAQVVPSDYGKSVCFFMKSGSQQYIPLATDAKSGVGDIIDLQNCELITLERQGDADILRIKD